MKLFLCLLLAVSAFAQYPGGAVVMHPIASVWHNAPADALSITRAKPLETVNAPFVGWPDGPKLRPEDLHVPDVPRDEPSPFFYQNDAASQPKNAQIRPSQVKTPIVMTPSVLIVLPSAPAVYAQLDPAMFWLDNTTTPPTLRVKMPTISYNAPLSFVLERNPDMTFTLPPIADGKYWTLSRNGVGQWNGIQYTVTGSVVKFTDPEQCCEADELITLTVWR